MALASSSMRPLLEAAIGKFGIGRHFSAILSGDEVQNGKPHPEIFLKAAKLLGVEPEHCVVFEDAPHGVLAAKRAGMKCIAIPNPFTSPEKLQQADRILGHLGEVDERLVQSLFQMPA
jgi:beta-phosphoglucomutase-like phosphatase (HAD superfamily)